MVITAYLIVPLLTWAIAQTAKFVLASFRGDFDVRYLIASGGMPSVHSAVVCSLVVVALAEGGPNSPLFGITGVMAAIVMYDSFGVRRSAGEQAKTLNRLIEDLSHDGDIRHPENYSHLREILGHRPIEVSVGAVLGILIALLFEADKLSGHLAFLTAPLTRVENIVFLGIGAVALVGGVISYLLLGSRFKKQKSIKSYRVQLLASTLIAGLALLFLVLGNYEAISYLNSRVLPYLVVIVCGIWLNSILVRLASVVTASKKQDVTRARRERWLKKAGRSHKKV